jgi:hypothetical protein
MALLELGEKTPEHKKLDLMKLMERHPFSNRIKLGNVPFVG